MISNNNLNINLCNINLLNLKSNNFIVSNLKINEFIHSFDFSTAMKFMIKKKKSSNYFYKNKLLGENLIVGDPISVSYRSNINYFSFEGLCIAKRFKKLKSLNSVLIMRSKINGIGVQVMFFYWLSFSFNYIRYDFKRIQHFKYGRYIFKLSKLYYTYYKYKQKSVSNK